MFKYLGILNFIIILLINTSSKGEISFKPLFDQSEKLFAKKILEVMPSLNTMKLGNEDSQNIIVEFIDYNCGYCKAIHSELISLTEKENLDLVIYFYQFPILSEKIYQYLPYRLNFLINKKSNKI